MLSKSIIFILESMSNLKIIDEGAWRIAVAVVF
jgi:hypothetical protein